MWQCSRLRLSIRIVQRQKEKRELNLGSRVVLDLCQVLKYTYCHLFFDNFCNDLFLTQELHDNGLYGLGTARCDGINTPQMKKGKEMKEITRILPMKILESHSLYQMVWQEVPDATLKHLEEITSISTVQRRLKGSKIKGFI